MATISALPSSPSSLSLSCRSCRRVVVSAWFHPASSSSLSLPFPSPSSSSSSLPCLRVSRSSPVSGPLRKTVRAVAEEEEEAQVPEGVEDAKESSPSDQPVSVPVSPSDMLTMFFKAEGAMDESAVTAVSRALEGTEGISDLKVQILEGIASVELTKQTTVQATGVASNLAEIIQGSGFKLQTLNLSFEDEEDAIN